MRIRSSWHAVFHIGLIILCLLHAKITRFQPTLEDGELAHRDPVPTRILVKVVDSSNAPIENAQIRVWGIDSHPTQSRPIQSDELGEAIVEIENLLGSTFCLTAKTDQLAGFREVYTNRLNLAEVCTIELKPAEDFTPVVVDFDTGMPIANCRVNVWFKTPSFNIRVGSQNFVTGENGQLLLKGLFPGLYAIVDASCQGFHDFDSDPALNYSVHIQNGTKEQLEIALLTESTYRRTIESARLRMPDVSRLKPSIALETLTKNFQRLNENEDQSSIGHWHSISESYRFLGYMRAPVIGFYRNAIWDVAQLDPSSAELDDDTLFDALIWLLHYRDESTFVDSVKNHDVAAAIVNQLATHPEIHRCLLSIRSFHQQPQIALEKIARLHPDRHTQALALEQLVYLKSLRFFCGGGDHVLPEDIRKRQADERKYLERLSREYGNLQTRYKQTYKRWAIGRIRFLDQFAIGGTPPELKGQVLNTEIEESVSLLEYRGKVVVIHYWPSREYLDFADLKLIAAQHPEKIQLLGMTYGNRAVAKRVIGNHKINWPILWDWHKGMLYRPIMTDDPDGLMWGEQKANHFRVYSTIVLDEYGVIRAVGLKGSELIEFVDSMLAE